MTWIKAPQDDLAVRQLRRNNSASNAIKHPGKVLASENNVARHARIERNINFKQHERRKTDRRKKERRQRNDPVVLNTRMQYDRRRSDRRQAEDQEQTLAHIDKYC